MKRNQTVIAALLLASALCLTACGENSSVTSQSSISADTSISEAATSPTESSKEESVAETTAPAPKNTVIDFGHIGIEVPGNFHIGSGEPGLYLGVTEHNPKVVFIYSQDTYYKSEHEDETYTAADVPEILNDNISSKLGSYYPSMPNDEYTIDAEEEVDILGEKFILRKGSLIGAPGSSSEEKLQFAGCYGVIDSQKNDQKDIPLAWIAYTNEMSEEALAELEEVIRNAAKSAQYTS